MSDFYTFLNKIICATAWSMEKPKAYGAFHLTFFIVGLLVSVVAAYLLRNLGDKGHKRLLVGVGAFLMTAEVYKILFHYFFLCNCEIPWWIFPFQLCSVPMYLSVIAPLIKQGTVSKAMYNFMAYFNLFGGFVAFIEPSGLVHDYLTITLHAFIWHMTLVFIGLYLLFSGRAGATKKDYIMAIITFVILCGVAFAINVLLRDVSGGSVNCFYIGPSNSPIIVFKDISEKYGWYVSTALYIPCICLGAFLIYLPFSIWRKKHAENITLNKNLRAEESR